MALSKHKLGEFLLPYDCRNKDLSIRLFQGISTNKVFTNPKQVAEDIASTKIVRKGQFAYNKATTRNGEKISIAYRYEEDCAVSSAYQVFYIKEGSPLLPGYLLMFFKRPEFDRYVRCNSWGSAHEFFTFEDMCDVEIELPDLPTQQKYVDIYNSMVANQQCYERGLEDLKLVCDGYIEDLRRNHPCEKIGPYIEKVDEKNTESLYGVNDVKSVNMNGTFAKTVANVDKNRIHTYKVVRPNDFAYTNRINIGSIARRLPKDGPCLVSASYDVFRVVNTKKILPEYLMLWIRRDEFFRSTGFYAVGSVKDNFSVEMMKELAIPIPDIQVQKAIANIYSVYIQRQAINEQLKAQIKNVCPILIKGSLEEGK